MQSSNTFPTDLLYSTRFKKYIDWPFTCARFSNVSTLHKNYSTFHIFLSYRTDSDYIKSTRTWTKAGSSMLVAKYELPAPGMQFIEEYEDFYGVENRQKVHLGSGAGVGHGNLEYTHGFVRVYITIDTRE